MSEMITQTEYTTYKDIEKLYDGEKLPSFTEAAAIAIRNFLDDHGCKHIAGAMLLDNDRDAEEAKSVVSFTISELRDETFFGPNIMHDHFLLNGIGVWTKGDLSD